jgi:diaminopimelate decarboxylase
VASSSEDAAAFDRLAPLLRGAARRFGTPVAVTDIALLEAAAERMRRAFPDPWLRAFSLKANDVAGIVGRIGGLGFDANVVSSGEWAIARRAGVPNARITLEGVGKTDSDLRAAVRSAAEGDPIRWIAIESSDEAEALVRLARGLAPATALDVLFRLNPEVAPETLHGLAVGAATSKFGMTATELSAGVELVASSPGLVPRGIHLHVGSQLGAVDAWREGVRRALALLALLGGRRRTFDTLDVGGGFPIDPDGGSRDARGSNAGPGSTGQPPGPELGPERFARELPALLAALPLGRRPKRLAVEPGRALVARAGFLVARVLHVRDREGRQIVLDTGMTELVRPALYDAWHEISALTSMGRPWAGRAADPRLTPARVEGPICESTDHLGEHVLPPLRRGDLVAIHDAGAYGASMGSLYNGRPRPAQVLLETDGRLVLARRRGRLEALG